MVESKPMEQETTIKPKSISVAIKAHLSAELPFANKLPSRLITCRIMTYLDLDEVLDML